MSDLLEVAAKAREIYLDAFRAAIKELGDEIMAEPALRDEDGSLVVEGDLELPIRYDLVRLQEGEASESIQVDSDQIVDFEEFEMPLSSGRGVRVIPFLWDCCPVLLRNVQEADWTPLRDWFMKWFDGEDENEPTPDGLQEVVHFLSDPDPSDLGSMVLCDFGTAPLLAFEEFVSALGQIAPQAQIGLRDEEWEHFELHGECGDPECDDH
jgi:hypothetical protein